MPPAKASRRKRPRRPTSTSRPRPLLPFRHSALTDDEAFTEALDEAHRRALEALAQRGSSRGRAGLFRVASEHEHQYDEENSPPRPDRLMATIDTRVFSLRDARNATIRTAEASDAAEVLAFRKTVADETEHLMGAADEIRRDVAQQAEYLQTTLLSPVDLLLLAEVEGRVAGIAGLEGSRLRRFAHGVTLGMAVGREFWRLGLGRALMESLLLWADTHGVVRVALEVVETNTPAIRLYESLGFEHEGRLRARRKHGDVYLDNHMMSRVRRGPDPSRGAVPKVCEP